MAHRNRNSKQLARIEGASLESLIENFPEEWQAVGQELVQATATKRPEALEAFVRSAKEAARPYEGRVENSGKNPQVLAVAMPFLVRKRMALLAAQRALQAAAMGASPGRRRFGLWSGFLVQRLFFSRGLVRKPVSMRRFRRLWPLVTQKRLLMPLVQPRGMYAFYSQELVAALARLIDGRPALEIAAGDGCLSGFLQAAGVNVRATDDHSWTQNIRYPDSVEKLDAATALKQHQPKVVLCSYPPPKNTFEQCVFRTDSVELYIVITTKHRFAAGDWQTYESQRTFAMTADGELSRLILPPEIDPLLILFTRNSAADSVPSALTTYSSI
jgi:hypothetical protein